MTKNFNNGMSNKVAAANNSNNNQNNIETLKGMIIAGHDGAKDFGYAEYGRDWFINYGDYTIYINRCYGNWGFSIFKNYKSSWTEDGRKVTYDDKLTPHTIYINGKRWSMSLAENMAKFILDTIADYESEQDWADFLDMCDRKAEIVSAYQTEIDGYVQDIIAIADKMENIENKVDAFAIKEIVKKIAQTEQDCYDAIMDADCDCFGTEICLSALWNWYNNYEQHYIDLNFSREDLNLEDLISTLDYMITESDKTLGLDEEDLEYINEGGCYCFDGYPMYLWQNMREFAATYYHYAYCA